MHKVLIVDDHESMTDSLSQALKNSGDFEVLGSLKRSPMVPVPKKPVLRGLFLKVKASITS